MFTKDFAKEVFSGRKRLLKMREAKFVNVTKNDEISVKNLYDKFLSLEGMKFYFPDKYPKNPAWEFDLILEKPNMAPIF